MAFAACVLLGAALRLAPAGTPEDDQPGDAPAARAWRRRRDRDPVQEDGLPAPADLTVTPAAPFARPDTPS